MDNKKQTVFDDLKGGKAWILGVLGLASAVAVALITYFDFPPTPTWIIDVGIIVFVLFIGWLVEKSEKRQIARLNEHQAEADTIVAKLDKKLNFLTDMAIENQKSGLRTEMNQMINSHPENHDTILKYAERYFCEYDGDWVETDIFQAWVESENALGRKVHILPQLQTIITAKIAEEKNK